MKWFLFLFIFLNYFSLFSMNSTNEKAGDYYDDYRNPLGILTLHFSKNPKSLLGSLHKGNITLLNRKRFLELQRNLSEIERMIHPCDIALYFNKGHLSDTNSFLQLTNFLNWLNRQKEGLVARIIAISLVENSLNKVPARSLRYLNKLLCDLNHRHQIAKENFIRQQAISESESSIRPISLFLYGNDFTTDRQKMRILDQLLGINVSF